MTKAKKTTRTKSAVLKKATAPSNKERITDEKQILVSLRNYLKGYKMDAREARANAAAGIKNANIAGRIVIKQMNMIDKTKARIEKLKAA